MRLAVLELILGQGSHFHFEDVFGDGGTLQLLSSHLARTIVLSNLIGLHCGLELFVLMQLQEFQLVSLKLSHLIFCDLLIGHKPRLAFLLCVFCLGLCHMV